MYFDAHNHLQDSALAPHMDAIAAAYSQIGLSRAVVNGTCENDWPDVAALARHHAWALPSFGLHPWDAGNRSPAWLDTLRAALDANPSAHIGEIGLDRWILESARPDDARLAGLRRAPLGEQAGVFREQLVVAAERNLAASIHCLDAFGALLQILETTPRPERGFLLHAYSGPAEMVARFVELGAYFSFNGNFLAEKKQRHRAVFAQIPLERLLAETDAPAMPLPASHRAHALAGEGEKLNHPANIAAVYSGLATLRAMPQPAVEAALEKNFRRLFGGATS